MKPWQTVFCILTALLFFTMWGCNKQVNGQTVPTPPAIVKPLGAGSQTKGATAQLQGAKASLMASLPKYINVLFDVDQNTGQPGYINVSTWLQGSTNLTTWTNTAGAIVSGNTNGAFSIPVLSQPHFYRMVWGIGQIK